MPEMISLRNFRLATTTGHVVLFEANTPREVPLAVVPEALAAGCAMTNAAEQPFIDDTKKMKFPLEGDIRRSVVYLVSKALAEENKTKNFDAGGQPKVSVVSDRAGFDVPAGEIRAVYQQVRQDAIEGNDAVLHPNAQLAVRIGDATSLADLTTIAEEMKFEHTKGKTNRELREALLSRLIGTG